MAAGSVACALFPSSRVRACILGRVPNFIDVSGAGRDKGLTYELFGRALTSLAVRLNPPPAGGGGGGGGGDDSPRVAGGRAVDSLEQLLEGCEPRVRPGGSRPTSAA
jgi:hypothetical protein